MPDKEHKKRTLQLTVIIFMLLVFLNVISWIYALIDGNYDIALNILILSVIIIMAGITLFTIKAAERISHAKILELPYSFGSSRALERSIEHCTGKRGVITKPYAINEKITLSLESNRTKIYIDGKEFVYCKYILLNIRTFDIEKYDNIKSIDDVAITHDSFMEHTVRGIYKITPEQEFGAHCSNIQAWVENDYDTRLLHSNLSFPLLRKLTEVGDKKAGIVFKEEVAKRYIEGNINVRRFLQVEGYLDHLSIDELMVIIRKVLINEGKIKLRINLKLKNKNGRNSV